MIGIGTLAKLVKGGFGPDELAAICEAAGLEVDFSDVPMREYRAAFGQTGQALTHPGSKLTRIRGRGKNGDAIEALIVLVPCPDAQPKISVDKAPSARLVCGS